MSLANKYRPKTPEEIIGQPHVSELLKNINNIKSRVFLLHSKIPGVGKAQPLDSLVLTPTGFKKMGELQIGDGVCTETGGTSYITDIFPQGEKDIYEVEFSDGTKAECCNEHLWNVKKRYENGYTTKSLEEIQKDYFHKERSQYYIPICDKINFIAQDELPINPYLLGVLLGDGCFATQGKNSFGLKFSTKDDELLGICSNIVKDYNITIKKVGNNVKKCDYSLTSNDKQFNYIIRKLKELDLVGKLSNEKFIPHIYKISSINDRIELLRGLLDTDGYITKRKKKTNSCLIIYTTTSKKLAEDIIFLIQSLGGVVRIKEKQKYFTYKGVKKPGKLSFDLIISLPNDIIPFKLKRRVANYCPRTKYYPTRIIKNITYIGKKEAQCILIDSPNHLYLTNNFIVTHNTTIARLIAMLVNPGFEQKILAQKTSDVQELNFSEARGIDAARDLINISDYMPSELTNKIYILDEFHQATLPAQNSLLKLFEEVPNNTYFILCTTDKNSIIPTIQSRCMSLEALPVSPKEIYAHLINICKEEQFSFENDGIDAIATNCKGSVRTAITYLEQASKYNKITKEVVEKYVLVSQDDKLAGEVIEKVLSSDLAYIFNILKDFSSKQLSIREFAKICAGECIKKAIETKFEVYTSLSEKFISVSQCIAEINAYVEMTRITKDKYKTIENPVVRREITKFCTKTGSTASYAYEGCFHLHFGTTTVALIKNDNIDIKGIIKYKILFNDLKNLDNLESANLLQLLQLNIVKAHNKINLETN